MQIGEEVTKGKKEKVSAARYCADFRRQAVELDHDEPPDGESQGEEDGDSVDHHREVDVEQHKDSPTKRHLGNIFCQNKNWPLTVSVLGISRSFKRLMWMIKGMYSIMTRQSATAMPVRIMLTGFLMFLWVSTRMLARLNRVPNTHTSIASQP